MRADLNRRQLIAALGSAAVRRSLLGGFLCLGNSPVAYADYYQPIQYDLVGDLWDVPEDPRNRKQIVNQAMHYVWRRFLDVEIASNVYTLDNVLYGQTDELWDTTNLDAYYSNLGRRDVLWYQLRSLREWYQNENAIYTKPRLSIHSYNKDENAVARAHYNTVQVVYDQTGFRVTGDFSVFVNFHYLGEAGCYSDPLYWAITIAHEMLHNLGHDHDASLQDPYYDRRQMIVFENAFYRDGAYHFDLPSVESRCGGPPL